MSDFLITKMYNHVLPLYQEKERVFHNEEHLNAGLYLLQRAERDLHDISLIQFAAWLFHDSVYVVGANDNEFKSAEYFEAVNQSEELGFTDEDVKIVKQIIMDTVNHQPTHELSKFVLDIDMLIIGSTYEDFVEYREKISKEYSTIYSDNEIKEGTKQFLDTLLETEVVFHTDYFKKYEVRAKENVKRYIEEYLSN